MVPNYAYGQDVGKGFKGYYSQLVPDGQIVNEQFPEFDEDDFTPFINAMVGANPDGILTAFFSSFILPFASQWGDSGNDADIPVISGLASVDAMLGWETADAIPANFYGYDRGNYRLLAESSASARSTSTCGSRSTATSTRFRTRSRSSCSRPGRWPRR